MAAKPPTLDPTWPNAGAQRWYESQLQRAVEDMNDSVLAGITAAWTEAEPMLGFAHDEAPATVMAAGVMFRTYAGHILLVHRTDGEGWAFPAGGLEAMETPEAGAWREASEETGYALGGRLAGPHTQRHHDVLFHTFECRIPLAFTPFLNHEHDAYQWVSPSWALETMTLHPGVRRFLADIETNVAMDAKNPSVLLRAALKKWGGLWLGKLDKLSLDLSRKFADKSFVATQASMQAAFKKAGFTVKFKPTARSVASYEAVVGENVNLIRSIPQQYLKDVESQVWQSVMRGGDLHTLTKGIQEKYGVAYRRAATIARDQNNKATAVLENTRRQELGFKEAFWMHSSAGKVPRPTHMAMNGKRYTLSEGMYDSAIAKNTWPGVEINCRCTSRAILPGFEDFDDTPAEKETKARLNAQIQKQWKAKYAKE